jgi:hypothetical protein
MHYIYLTPHPWADLVAAGRDANRVWHRAPGSLRMHYVCWAAQGIQPSGLGFK